MSLKVDAGPEHLRWRYRRYQRYRLQRVSLFGQRIISEYVALDLSNYIPFDYSVVDLSVGVKASNFHGFLYSIERYGNCIGCCLIKAEPFIAS